jgi:hypothetical protein
MTPTEARDSGAEIVHDFRELMADAERILMEEE